MGFFTGREPAFSPRLTTPEDADAVVLGPVDSFLATLDHASKRGGAWSDPLRSRYEASLAALADANPDDPELSRALIPDATSTTGLTVDQMGERLERFGPQLAALREKGVSVQTRDEAFAQTVEEARNAEARAARAMGVPGFLGTAVGEIIKPVNLATLPLGAAAGSRALTKIMAQAGINLGTEAVVELAQVAPTRRRLGLEWSPAEAAANIAAAGVGGAIFEGLGIAAARAYRAAVGAGRIAPSLESEAAAELVEDAAQVAARNPVPDLNGSARAHLEALEAARQAVERGEVAPSLFDVLGRRLADAESAEGRLAAELGEAGEAAASLARARPTNFAFDVIRPALRNALGTDVTVTRVPGGARVEAAGRVLEISDEAGLPAAREALDAFTDELGLARVPLSKRERLAATLDETRAAREAAARRLEGAQVEASRRVGDRVGQPGGRPFKTRKDAMAYARRAGAEGFEVVRSGRGFLLELRPTPEQAAAARAFDFDGGLVEVDVPVRAAMPDEPAAAFAARVGEEDLAGRAAREAMEATGDDTMTVADVEAYWRHRATGEGPLVSDGIDPDDAALVASLTDEDLAAQVAVTRDGAIVRNGDGVAESRRLSEIVEEADADMGAIRSIKECMLG